jgi:hypothetical protein
MQPPLYEWTYSDKRRYVLAMVPFVFAAIMAALVLASSSVWLVAGWVGLFLLLNFFQAGCCVGCPYRGRYCPAILGVYLGNWLSSRLYRDRTFDQKFFDRNATAGEITMILFLIFPIYWLWSRDWILVPLFLVLLAGHFVLFLPTQCEYCSYNETCPGGQVWESCKRVFRLG